MVLHIVQSLNVDIKYLSVEKTELSKLLEQTRLKYESMKNGILIDNIGLCRSSEFIDVCMRFFF